MTQSSPMGQIFGNPSLILRTKNVRRVAEETLNPDAFNDISNVNLDQCTILHLCYIPLKIFLKQK